MGTGYIESRKETGVIFQAVSMKSVRRRPLNPKRAYPKGSEKELKS